MTFRLRHLRLTAITSVGPYGADIPFGPGLNVIWADNTKGKSTCMQGMLYALGMERMLSPRREVPLPHAMTSFLQDDSEIRHEVLESRVSLEIENGAGHIITVHRPIKSAVDNRLISVDFGPTLTDNNAKSKRRDFFVLDPGAASREDGFHHFFEQFLGWELPIVRRFDAPDTKLYLETIFPLFWVEQKSGWSSIPAAIPTYLRIREVHKRAVEFIMNLDVHKLELRKQHLEELIAENGRDWRNIWDEIGRFVQRSGGQVEALPQKPTSVPDELSRAHILIADNAAWIVLDDVLARLRARVAELATTAIPEVGEKADESARLLDELNRQVEIVNVDRIQISRKRQLKDSDINSLKQRIKSLTEDLQKNQDVQKLQRYSGRTAELTLDRCPTCEQSLEDTLLAQGVLTAVMPIEDNIEYIRSQLRMFQDILRNEEERYNSLVQEEGIEIRRITELYGRIRTLRSELVAPANSPSAVAIEERLRTEARIRELEGIQAAFEDAIDRMMRLMDAYRQLLEQLSSLPPDKMSPSDRSKLQTLTDLLQEQAREYGFKTFNPVELSIAEETYRPQKEGFEIGFETSASDAIRLKWAYQLGLLELATQKATNHPGMLIFDEPRQQSSSKISFARLLQRASLARNRNQQIIFSTSEDLDNLRTIIDDIECNAIIFPGYVVQPQLKT